MTWKLSIYLLPRMAIGGLVGWQAYGPTWPTAAGALLFGALALAVLKTDWFEVDFSNPWMPLKETERSRTAKRKAFRNALSVTLRVLAIAAAAWVLTGTQLLPASKILAAAVSTFLISRVWQLSTPAPLSPDAPISRLIRDLRRKISFRRRP